jgi:alkanesulfonate monooxygenase SsuD/methylene tetrahydromethanopterin reductase-like flavin-dependent oxidoreductase (luciferase family)
MFERDVPPELLRERVRLFEDVGLDDVWVVEDMSFAGGIATAATALSATRSLRVGIGILPSMVRNPLFAAMEIAALSRLYPGRVLPGIGHGMQDWMTAAGARPRSPLAALDEVLTCVGDLLRGNSVTVDGQYVHLDGARLQFPPRERMQLLAGVRGERSIRLAGAVCDGVILAEPLSPAYVRWARALVDEAAAKAGRARPTIVAYTWLSVGNDGRLARERVLPMLASIPGGLSEPSVRRSLSVLDFGPELVALIDRAADQRELAAGLQPAWVTELTVTGTPHDCATAIQRLAQAGADRVVLAPLPDDVAGQAALLGREVLPLLSPAGPARTG